MKHVGIDGCKGGWVAVWTAEGQWGCTVYPTIRDLWKAHLDAGVLLLDMPIGLARSGDRKADIETRKRLGARKSSLFNAPVRGAVYAGSKAEAREINRLATGKSLSEQSLCLINKMQEVDMFLTAVPEARAVFRESHPELAFSLVAGTDMRYAKRDVLGVIERFELLELHVPGLRALVASVRERHVMTQVAGDDILDACILCVMAWKSRGRLASIPDPPERDENGLPMAIWYYDITS
ncbi:DUF429 domain-containing protein [Pseudodesulfovibrio sediminis]|uniref:DUF429 domain-containing protein n=1 Tax=Pseudodesulfovibrio sediminis TaxID=2810563 RepID=A0ABM7P7G6_9BACT|nr:DUF429 domain-containing protein [Pseudodesulfovibrio sediminis]BCS88932.1 hypothetical protein PSDVSF_21740 [Pseudodesulfovibrio sediminis]